MAKHTAGSYHRTTIYLTDAMWPARRLDRTLLWCSLRRVLYHFKAGPAGRPSAY